MQLAIIHSKHSVKVVVNNKEMVDAMDVVYVLDAGMR